MVHRLLDAHPNIVEGDWRTEDFVLANAHHLLHFVDRVTSAWAELNHGVIDAMEQSLVRNTWQGVERHLLTAAAKPADAVPGPIWCVSRTPNTENLHLLATLTDTKALVVVRDGRAVLESGMRSFGWSFEEHLHRWTASAKRIREAMPENPDLLLVRYEDVIKGRPAEAARILEFLDIDPETYPFDGELKVYGSSEQLAKGQFWEGNTAPVTFDPLNRWSHWTEARMQRFNHVAGAEMQHLGYELAESPSVPRNGVNAAMDLLWPARRAARAAARQIVPQQLRAKIMWKRGQSYRHSLDDA